MTSPPAVDLFTQALKSLSEKNPFESEEFAARSTSLPFGVARELSRSSDSKQKHKKSGSHGEHVSPDSSTCPKKSSSLWDEMEVYFRPIGESDINILRHKGLDKSLFLIPVLESRVEEVEKDVIFSENEVRKEMEVDSVEYSTLLMQEVMEEVKEEEEDESDCNCLNWVLGSRNRDILATQRPTKKRKLIGSDAGLERILKLPHAEESGSVFCDVCCMHVENMKSKNVVTCDECKIVVHKKCCGIGGKVESPWVCYQCKELEGNGCCLLCPKKVGVMKRAGGEGKIGEEKKYVHLFCSMWTPEAYVEDVESMEPVMNVGAVPDLKWKLVCNACKAKHGVCIRCSCGTCRTAFHPICAREARYRMEIWGKVGCGNVELRAYCSKHSTSQEIAEPLSNKLKLKLSCKSKENNMTQGVMENSDYIEVVKTEAIRESPESSDMQSTKNIDFGASENDNILLNFSNLLSVVKKLINRGKIIVDDVASEIGISSDSFEAALMGEISSFSPELRLKMIKWFHDSVYLPASLHLKPKSDSAPAAIDDCPNPVEDSNTDNVDACSIKPLSSLRTVQKKVGTSTAEKTTCFSGEKIQQTSNGKILDDDIDKVSVHTEIKEDTGGSMSPAHASNQNKDEGLLEMIAVGSQFAQTFPNLTSQVRSSELKATLEKNELSEAQHHPVCTIESTSPNDLAEEKERIDACFRFYAHPFIKKRLTQLQKGILLEGNRELNSIGQSGERVISSKSRDSYNCNLSPSYNDLNYKVDPGLLDQLTKAKQLGILESSPEDEIEGEMLYLQNKLLDNASAIQHSFENLLGRIVKKLPQEIHALKKQQWDLIFVNKYLCEVKEEKKRGRKERKHREAQVVLAAATAAAASSTRLLRKDGNHDANTPDSESPQMNSGLLRRVSPLGSRLKESSRSTILKNSPENKHSKENVLYCDICRRPETLLNRLFVCSSCKVAVHLDCYRKNKDLPIGPWKCELCEDFSQSGSPRNQPLNATSVNKCGLCGGGSGAFRKATNGQWVHAFCAEWLLEPTFKRGQPEPVDGMDALFKEKGVLTCSVCHQNFGACIKCSYGHCQVTFHPSCARTADFYMNIKATSGSLHHKSYCEKHSVEQRQKADNQQYGSEELKSLKQIRFELEKVRILCERIIKREKVKKDLVVCLHDILACKRDHVAQSVRRLRGSNFPSGVSSESATTSIDNKSYSGTNQRSEDITVDSTVSGTRIIKLSLNDGPTSQLTFKRKIPDRTSYSGKQLPYRTQSHSFQNPETDGDKRIKVKKPTENFLKEVVMTSHQASMQNRRLPKGFVYVPIDSLSKEKAVHDSKSREPEEPGG